MTETTQLRVQETVYEILTGEDDGRVCKDIPDAACDEQPGNFVKHVLSLAGTKMGDGLSDPKLVLAWLLGAVGAPAFLVGLLVPVREAGALLPQLLTAASIRAMNQRKWAWTIGSLVQGLAVIGMGTSAALLEGAAAGWTIVVLLAILAVARSVCSVSYKDVLGKTVSKSTRGTATGSASTLAAAGILIFGLLLSFGILPKSVGAIAVVLYFAGCLWIGAAIIFSTLEEAPGATEGGGNPLAVARENLSLLRTDGQLRVFIATRALLIGTALAPPYLLAMAGRSSDRSLGSLGLFVIASSLAAILSTYFWGRLSDVSSRRTLIASACIAAGSLGIAGSLGFLGQNWIQNDYLLPCLLFLLMIAYQGVRLGRSTHIVDMADQEKRAAYTALSNTVIGVFLLAGGVFGALAQVAGEAAVLLAFCGLSITAALVALRLEEVQTTDA